MAAAGGAAAIGGKHAPAAAAHGSQRAALGTVRIVGRAFEVVVLLEPVLHPFLHVAVHVVEAPRVGERLRDRRGALAAVLAAAAREDRVVAGQPFAAAERRSACPARHAYSHSASVGSR